MSDCITQYSYDNLSLPFLASISGGLSPFMTFIISGSIKPATDSFTIELRCGNDIAFHMNPRFSENSVVRNSLIDDSWGPEERFLPDGMPFAQDQTFTVRIRCEVDCFTVAVNGNHQFDYKHRIKNLSSINQLNVFGDIELTLVQSFLYCGSIPGGLSQSRTIIISGFILPTADSFTIDLRCGNDIAFHLKPRFLENSVVRNSLIDNLWGPQEVFLPGAMPFTQDQNFLVNIRCEDDCLKVAIDGKHQFDYNHRIKNLQSINQLNVFGDIKVTGVQIQ